MVAVEAGQAVVEAEASGDGPGVIRAKVGARSGALVMDSEPAGKAGSLFKTLGNPAGTDMRKLEIPVRDMHVLFFLLLVLCLGEWFFRKRNGLA